jgi:hypothetical protein
MRPEVVTLLSMVAAPIAVEGLDSITARRDTARSQLGPL